MSVCRGQVCDKNWCSPRPFRLRITCASLWHQVIRCDTKPIDKEICLVGILCRFTRPKHTKRFGRPRPCVHDVFTGRSRNLVPPSSERYRHKTPHQFDDSVRNVRGCMRNSQKVSNSFFDFLDLEISDSSCWSVKPKHFFVTATFRARVSVTFFQNVYFFRHLSNPVPTSARTYRHKTPHQSSALLRKILFVSHFVSTKFCELTARLLLVHVRVV
jgi:hypothetical protein